MGNPRTLDNDEFGVHKTMANDQQDPSLGREGIADENRSQVAPSSTPDATAAAVKDDIIESGGGSLPAWFTAAMASAPEGTTSGDKRSDDGSGAATAAKNESEDARTVSFNDLGALPETDGKNLGSNRNSARSNKHEGGSSRRSLAYSKQLGKSKLNMKIDDPEGKAEFFGQLLIESVGDASLLFVGSIIFVFAWSVLCAFGGERLRELAASDPGGSADRWVADIENGGNGISILGTLFVFSLVYRFQSCYDQWWAGRCFWGEIVSKCLELGTMNRSWIADRDLADRMSRFIILFCYASKAILRGKSLSEDGEDGPALVKRGLLTQEELDHMNDNPCWQPHYCLHMMRLILVEAHDAPGGKALVFDEKHKIHGKFFRCFDSTLGDLTELIGTSIRLKTSGMPASYDAIVMLSYFSFFIIASAVWGVSAGWLAPPIIVTASIVIMLFFVMGSNLCDPFGTDKVDIPLDAFCATVEAQIYAIDQRNRIGTVSQFAKYSTPKTHGWTSNASEMRSSMTCISPDLH